MNTKKILLGGIIGGIAFFLLGWVIYAMLLMDFMNENGNQCAMRPEEEMKLWAILVANIFTAILYAMIFSWSNTTSVAEGAKKGAIISLFFSIGIDLMFYSMTTMFKNFTVIIVDVAAYTVMGAIAGAVIVWAMNLGKKSA